MITTNKRENINSNNKEKNKNEYIENIVEIVDKTPENIIITLEENKTQKINENSVIEEQTCVEKNKIIVSTPKEEKIEELLDKEKPNQKEFIKIHNERIDRYIQTKIKETGNVEDFIIMCVQEHNKRERLKQERDAR